MDPVTLRRHAHARLAALRETFRIVMVEGARQVGKTTLVRSGEDAGLTVSLDDEHFLGQARDDPVGFVESLPVGTTVDEYQRAGEGFLLAVKRRVDRDRARGQLTLTGSSSATGASSATQLLAGRRGRLVLWPLSQGEIDGHFEGFVDRLLSGREWDVATSMTVSRAELAARICRGGYPEVVLAIQPRQRRAWFDGYVADVVSREELRPIADVRREAELRTVFRLLAARTAQELVVADLARDAGVHPTTAATYVDLLVALHLIHLLPGWATSATTRAKRRPRVHLTDTGLGAALTEVAEDAFTAPVPDPMVEPLFETFVVSEILKQLSWREDRIDAAHLRDRNGREIDLVLQDARRRVFAIEVKSGATVRAADARHLAWLRAALGERFGAGLVIHTGEATLRLSDRIWAVPVGAVWNG